MTSEREVAGPAPGAVEPAAEGSSEARSTAVDDRSDAIELVATMLLALATIMAAWSAYQATRWGGVQANAYSGAAAARTEATQQHSSHAAEVQIDVLLWAEYLRQRQDGNDAAAEVLRERMRDEFKPAFEEWLALAPEGETPPGTPFELESYTSASEQLALELNDEADRLSAEAQAANQLGDNFVLVAVIMASVLFFAGIGTKLRGRDVRLAMLGFGLVLFAIGVVFTFSMPQNVGI